MITNAQLVDTVKIQNNQCQDDRMEIERLTNEIQCLKKSLEQCQLERNQMIQTQINADDNNQRQVVLQQLTDSKVRE
jgi:hypothetical protein